MNAVDTNVVVYSVDADGKERRSRALELLATLSPADTVVPWQVVCELGAVLTRFASTGRTEADPAEVIHALTTRFRVVQPADDLVLRALQLRRTHQVSYWDSLLLVACVDAGVTRLYTEDIQGQPRIGGVEIINPFAGPSPAAAGEAPRQ